MKKIFVLFFALCVLFPACALSRKVVAYVTSWTQVLPDPELVTNINYAFGHVNDTFDGIKIDNSERLRKIVELKDRHPGLQIQLSIGGWGSGRFSEMAADEEKRLKFAQDCNRVMRIYKLDGIDIDWEYPTVDAAGISASVDDTYNFTKLMRDIREALTDSALLTVATVCNAKYIDFPAIMPYVDFVNIMAYDMANPPCHHSALYPSKIAGENTSESALYAHLKAGVSPEKLTLGIPFYGRGRAPYADFVNYGEIVLKDGCTRQWDNQACVPYIADCNGQLVLGYENERSIADKCLFIKNNGLLGAMYWEYGSDDSSSTLAHAVAQNILEDRYAANYAQKPRFNALIYYSDTAEEAHVQFAKQALDFFHKLSYGDGFTYKVTTSLAPYVECLNNFDVIIDINAMPGTDSERKAFEKYMDNGGGWMGFHAAAYNDVNTHWPWFNSFLGAGIFYCNNWPPQPALLDVDTAFHPVTRNLPDKFVAPESEFYQWDPSPRLNPDVEVLLSLSQRNYPFGIKDVVNFGDFPVVWTNKKYRMIYLNMGHGDTEFTDATQNLLFVNALRWIVSRSPKSNPFTQ